MILPVKLVLVTGDIGASALNFKGVVAGGGHVVVCSFDKEEVVRFVQDGEGNYFFFMDISDGEAVKKGW